MQFSDRLIFRWLPAALMMAAIFVFSATPSKDVPFSVWRYVFSKGGHVIGYTMLTLSLWRGFGFNRKRLWLAWLFAFLYAITDEYHQSFVPGRHPAALDVLVFDNAGALIAVGMAGLGMKKKQPVRGELVVDPLASK